MKRNRKICWGLVLVIMIIGLTACSASKSDEKMSMNSETDYSMSKDQEVGYDAIADISPEEATETPASAAENKITGTNQKLITYVTMSIETLEYDSLMESINNKITQVNGYIQASESYGRHMNSTNLQNANMTIRVPSDKVNEFISFIGDTATVTNKSIQTDDVTMAYVDTEARKKALETQQDRLFALLEKAEKMEDIIALEQRIGDVTYELENYTSSLRTYDNLVAYSTVTLEISEVERESNPEPENIWDEMRNGLSDTLYNIKEGFQSFAIWVVSNIPYLIFWALVITGGIMFYKKKRNKKVKVNEHIQDETQGGGEDKNK